MFSTWSSILEHALKGWASREANKFIEELYELRNEYDNEIKKPSIEDREKYPELKDRDFRNNAYIDDLDNKLFNLGQAFITAKKS